jgi:hypothetical protein
MGMNDGLAVPCVCHGYYLWPRPHATQAFQMSSPVHSHAGKSNTDRRASSRAAHCS